MACLGQAKMAHITLSLSFGLMNHSGLTNCFFLSQPFHLHCLWRIPGQSRPLGFPYCGGLLRYCTRAQLASHDNQF